VTIRFRTYESPADRTFAHRIWREIGWMEKDQELGVDALVEAGSAMVAELAGEPECLVTRAPGEIRYLDRDLPFACLTSVTTSRIARKQGLAAKLTARAIAEAAAEGALVAGLSMFEQGFYNQLGFGTGGYEHRLALDPSQLALPVQHRVPRRLDTPDLSEVHSLRLRRLRGHGSCNLFPAGITKADTLLYQNVAGLGYHDGPEGALSHCLWFSTKELEHGPYEVIALIYQSWVQMLELLALIKSFGDQIRLVRLREPAGLQLQDLLERPFYRRAVSQKSSFAVGIQADAYWQMRICDLPACLAMTTLPIPELRFNLVLTDPIGRYLDHDAPWRGISGSYRLALGSHSSAELGIDENLSTMTASVGAFTRMWLGVLPASGLSVTDDLSGPPGLLSALDTALRLPRPSPDWDF
jgi:GNAT superfamily N-acetyltransferase